MNVAIYGLTLSTVDCDAGCVYKVFAYINVNM